MSYVREAGCLVGSKEPLLSGFGIRGRYRGDTLADGLQRTRLQIGVLAIHSTSRATRMTHNYLELVPT